MTEGKYFDFIIIGTGAGGGTLAYRLAQSGKSILILERGGFLPQEKQNWDTASVFQESRYNTMDTWEDREGNPFYPRTGYWVGGNTKVYGASLVRFRERDFETVEHIGGISPEWPVKYADFEPYYCEAEKLYCVRGERGSDPTEPPASCPYPFPALSNEPHIQGIHDSLVSHGLKPFPVPTGLKLEEADRVRSLCIRCDTCDGYPCMIDAKSDADVNCIRPIYELPNVTLVTEAKVERLHTDASGRTVSEVRARLKDGSRVSYRGSIVVVACGAINSAALLLQSANDKHPRGLANSSDGVGRNLMFHLGGAVLSIGPEMHASRYMKTFAVSDFYWGEKDFPYPMGLVQPIGSFNLGMIRPDGLPSIPGLGHEEIAARVVPWVLLGEDLPNPENRVRVVNGATRIEYRLNNEASFARLKHRWLQVLKEVVKCEHVIPFEINFRKRTPLEGVGHQNGTCRFGTDPRTSVLDVWCRTHDVENLYVVDAAFFPSSAGVNPSLTIMANALRVGDHLLERLG